MTTIRNYTDEQKERIRDKRWEMLLKAVGDEYGLAAKLKAMRGGGWR